MNNIYNPILNISTGFKNTAVGIIRISFGNVNKKFLYFFLKKIFYKIIKPKIINFVFVYNLKNFILDKSISLFFCKPNSYTGDDLLEIHSHGNIFLLNLILKNLLVILKKYNVKLSRRGEFTKRSFNNKKIDVFELEKIYFLLNFKNIFFFKNFKKFLNYNYKNIFLKIFYLINKIELFNFLKFDIEKKYFKNIIFFLKILKNNIFFIIKKSYIIKKKNFIIILGISNIGKSTFLNSISKNNFSIVSNFKGTTRDILKKKIKINFDKYYFFDTSGLNNSFNITEYINILFSIKKICFSKFIFYFFDCILFYNLYFYFVKKKINKNQILIKILNKIDILKIFSYFEIYIIKSLKCFFIYISSKKKHGLFYIFNIIKKKKYKNFFNFNNIFSYIIKKCYKIFLKIFFFFFKKNFFLFYNEILKFKKLILLLINKKNKFLFNKIFKKFCLGK